jgi:hypothetical protein
VPEADAGSKQVFAVPPPEDLQFSVTGVMSDVAVLAESILVVPFVAEFGQDNPSLLGCPTTCSALVHGTLVLAVDILGVDVLVGLEGVDMHAQEGNVLAGERRMLAGKGNILAE